MGRFSKHLGVGKELVKDNFSLDVMVKRYEQLYEDLLRSRI